LRTSPAKFWREYADISKRDADFVWSFLRGPISRLSGGGSIKTASTAAQIVQAADEGFTIGRKAVTNAAAAAVVSTATLGYVEKYDLVEATDADRAYGYDTAFAFGKAGWDILVGVGTGGAAGALVEKREVKMPRMAWLRGCPGNSSPCGRGVRVRAEVSAHCSPHPSPLPCRRERGNFPDSL
jgi:hypothetical protein